MCGIFGFTINKNSDLEYEQIKDIFKDLFMLSESRGKEASGFAVVDQSEILVHKTPFPASKLVKSKTFKSLFNDGYFYRNSTLTAMGHSRLVTNGYEHLNKNNQPVIKDDIIAVHNGIIVNESQLWQNLADSQRLSDLDSELIPTITRKNLKNGCSLLQSIKVLFQQIYGMTNTAMLFRDYNNLLLATNNGSLYFISSHDSKAILFASEYYILDQLIKRNSLETRFSLDDIAQLEPNTACLVDINSTCIDRADLFNNHTLEFNNITSNGTHYVINEISDRENNKNIYINTSLEHGEFNAPDEFIIAYETRRKQIENLKRCSRCILPETFPYIEYDENGVCNYCHNYKNWDVKGFDTFIEFLTPFRRNNNKPEVLMPFSGGRDSSYALHFVKKELGLKPLAYSYDWGMLTDLSRRNQARMCGKLGVEHILISADIRKKRANIRKNVLAWLKRPSPGTVPLFMAGDKQYFYFANLLMKQNNIALSILGENMLETTNFKSGFCGIPPNFEKNHTYSLSIKNKMKLLLFYGKEYLLNPSYINSSLLDTWDAFRSYYIIKHQNVNIYDYIRWDEQKIITTLRNEYDWEIDPGTDTTWRIGDGTAAFYNYIYYMVAGFTEIDTFRSNQIREGDLIREQALTLSQEENKPRWDSIKWYCNTIKIDFEKTISRINQIPNIKMISQ